MTDEQRNREIEEAIRAGEQAFKSLKSAEEKLSSAGNWGIVDILGGGLFTNLIKHSKINDASSYMEKAKTDLKKFQRELKDIPDYGELNIDIGGFLSFADFFFDGILADCMVQPRISDAKRKVQEAARRTERLLSELRSSRR